MNDLNDRVNSLLKHLAGYMDTAMKDKDVLRELERLTGKPAKPKKRQIVSS